MKPIKPIKGLKTAHTSNAKLGMGDNYGQGLRAKVGRMREDSMGVIASTPRQLKTPPKSVA